jgi:hypothetical protein
MRAVFEKDEINREEMRSILKKHLSETDKDRNIVRPVYTY